MRPIVQKSLAGIGGVLVAVSGLVWALSSTGPLGQLLGYRTGLASEFQHGDAVYKKFGDIYTALSVVGLALAAGISFAVVAWERRPPRHRIHLLYWVLLAVLVPLSMLNFWSGDIFVSRGQQVWLNLAQCVLASLCLISLLSLSVQAPEAQVLRAIAVFFLAAQGVFVPALFSVLWLANWQGALSLATSRDLSPGWVTLIATFVSLAISVLQYRASAAKAKKEEAANRPQIIVS